MLVFHGGLTIEQVTKIKNGERIIYDKMTNYEAYGKIIMGKNTFSMLSDNDKQLSEEERISRIAELNYNKQYIFFFKYLGNALRFCVNTCKKNWVMVVDIPPEILSKSIGVGKYPHEGYKLEYMLSFVDNFDFNWIKDFQYFEPMDITVQMREKYENRFGSAHENDVALKVLQKTNKNCSYI